MKIFCGPRQSGRTELLIRKAIAAGSAMIVTNNHMSVKLIKDRLNQYPNKMDINVITFKQFISDATRGVKYSNIFFDDIDSCIDSIVPPYTKNTVATICNDDMHMVCDELSKIKLRGENEMVNIKGLNKAEVLLALWNRSHSQGISFLGIDVARPNIKDAEDWIKRNPSLNFDYVNGRIIKCNIAGDEFDPRMYDRDCGEGAAAAAIDKIRK